jgi:glycosyltransferase involved in cell wall biosynthesis
MGERPVDAMKIHLFTNDTSFTGGRLILFGHANALAERGHEVTVCVPGGGAVSWMDVRVPILDLDATGYAGLPAADACVFERRRFARPLCQAGWGMPVHFCQGFEGVDVDVRLARLASDPSGWLRVGDRWRLWRRRRVIDRDYALPTVKIVVQEHLREHLVQRYHQPVYLVPNGLPADVFTPGDGAERVSRTVLVVGPTDLRCKRITDALQAVRQLKQRCPEVRLVRVSQHAMGAAERQLGVTDEYHVLLSQAELAQQYRRASALAFPSDETEGFGLPMLEAMACGTPVVASDIPAARAFEPRGDHARFVSVGRPDLLADALATLLDDAVEQDRLRQRGLAVAARYTRARSHDALESTLKKIVAVRPAAAS